MGLNNITCRIGISAIGNRMAAKAKEYRYELEVRLMGAYCDLLAETDVTPVKKRALTKQMDNLDKVWDKLQKCHAEYCRQGCIKFTFFVPGGGENIRVLSDLGKNIRVLRQISLFFPFFS